MTAPVSAIVATKDRPEMLERTLRGAAMQSCIPMEVIIVDGSAGTETKDICERLQHLSFPITYLKASRIGAADQRMQGFEIARQPFVWFLDDDIIMEPDCVRRVFDGFNYTDNVGAVNAMITNQRYTTPGLVSRAMLAIMYGKTLSTYAGKVVGPAWNLLPEDDERLAYYVPCDWLNTTCTMYRREILPSPVFPHFFKDYSMFEDLALSATIAKRHVLLNARTARIYHDSQSGSHKNNVKKMAKMALVNRYYVMTHILEREGWSFNAKLFLLEVFGFITSLKSRRAILNIPKILWGKISGIIEIRRMRRDQGF